MGFLACSFPMIVNIYLDRRKRNCNFGEKTLKVVREYIKSRLPLNRRQRSRCAYLGDFEDQVFIVTVVTSFISVVVYLSFTICSPMRALSCFLNIVNEWKFPFTLSEISQVIYQYPLSTGGLVGRACSWTCAWPKKFVWAMGGGGWWRKNEFPLRIVISKSQNDNKWAGYSKPALKLSRKLQKCPVVYVNNKESHYQHFRVKDV